MRDCLDFETLLDYSEGRLPPASAKQSQEHLAACSKCTTQLSQLKQIGNLLREDARIVVPARAHQRALSIFRAVQIEKTQEQEKTQGGWKRRLARLTLDTGLVQGDWGVDAALGFRAAELGAPGLRQLLYQLDESEAELDLQINRDSAGRGWILLGQLLGLDSPAEQVELLELTGLVVSSAQPDQTGTFKFGPLTSGNYKLLAYQGENLIEINPLTL